MLKEEELISQKSERKKIGYLGPRGTFTEEALGGLGDDYNSYEKVPLDTFKDVIVAVERGELDYGFLPIENSIEGSVLATLDPLIFESNLLIQSETFLEIHQSLLGMDGSRLESLEKIFSYPHALAQCRKFIEKHLPWCEIVPTDSTASAARYVAETKNMNYAAIGPKNSARVYGLSILKSDVEDFSNNVTRFLLLAKPNVPMQSGHDKTSIVCFQLADRPGSLLSILEHFAKRNINLTKLESRPTKLAMGAYCFIIDFSGHIRDKEISLCLEEIASSHARVKFLGSYPRGQFALTNGQEFESGVELGFAGSGWVEALLNQL